MFNINLGGEECNALGRIPGIHSGIQDTMLTQPQPAGLGTWATMEDLGRQCGELALLMISDQGSDIDEHAPGWVWPTRPRLVEHSRG